MRGYYAFISSKKIALNKFASDGSGVEGFGARLTRVHLNRLEILPMFAALVIVASVSNQMVIMEATAIYILYARVAQSTIHMISTSLVAVLLRATCWVIQLALLLSYSYQLVM